MAMNTWLQLVSDDEIATLSKSPESINKLEKPKGECWSTYYFPTVNFFLTGTAYPSFSNKKPIGGALGGAKSVDTSTLENGSFGVVTVAEAKAISEALGKVDLAKVRAAIEEADLEELQDSEELDDVDLLVDEEGAPADVILPQIDGLIAFYKLAVSAGKGVAMYTS